MALANPFIAQSAKMGALPMLYAATVPDAIGGSYLGPSSMFETRGYPKVVSSNRKSHDRSVARQLWSASEQLTGVTYDSGLTALAIERLNHAVLFVSDLQRSLAFYQMCSGSRHCRAGSRCGVPAGAGLGERPRPGPVPEPRPVSRVTPGNVGLYPWPGRSTRSPPWRRCVSVCSRRAR